jgi:hypothetical protein
LTARGAVLLSQDKRDPKKTRTFVTIHIPNASTLYMQMGTAGGYVLTCWRKRQTNQPNAFQSPAPEPYDQCAEYQTCQMSLLFQLCTEGKVH